MWVNFDLTFALYAILRKAMLCYTTWGLFYGMLYLDRERRVFTMKFVIKAAAKEKNFFWRT